MVICEGPDGSGKTTLAKRLADEFSLEYRRPPESLLSSTTGPSEGLHDWWRAQLRGSIKSRKLGVYDRCFWLSEPIYAALTGRGMMVDGKTIAQGIHDLWAENPMIVFCMTDYAGMLENVYAAGRPRLADISGDERKLRAIADLYWASYGCWYEMLEYVVHWDYNEHEYNRVTAMYGDHAKNWR